MTTTTWLLILLALVLLLAAAVVGGHIDRWAPRGPSPTEGRPTGYSSHLGASRTYVLKDVPVPADLRENASPLTEYLADLVDRSLPASAAGQHVPHDAQEIRGLLVRVVGRINARHPGLRLSLVSFDNVKKTLDAYKTLRYDADVHVHSAAKAFSSRLTVGVDVTPDGKEFIRALRVHGAAKDESDVRGSGGVDTHDAYAPFEPAVRY
jgi:hypothetical protein